MYECGHERKKLSDCRSESGVLVRESVSELAREQSTPLSGKFMKKGIFYVNK